ncbi:DUF6049 family protein [Cellulomonas soli]|uniref:Uncharacterized protein n=1 Tax=Cellulomonas soli TaxID=931535 RepID=A0A512PI78_9CELL|nr:DUF6049 family protein [Cellulomonas soli]NYI58713.1 hypothetical protein [Cellulomonas soli]GEP70904.1 hypothetical protein CSO01_36190 [Cellulomonas soli]
MTRPAPALPGRSPRRSLRAVLATLLALPFVVGPLVAPAGATTSVGSSATATGTDTMPVTVQISEVSPAVLRPGQDLVVRATVRNDGDTTIEHPRATVLLNRFRPSTRAELQAWTDLAPTAAAGRPTAQVTLTEPLAPGATAPVEVTVPAAAIGLLEYADSWGPRGLSLEIGDGGRRVGLQRTFLLWLTAEDVAQTRVSVLFPVVGPATSVTTTTEDESTATSDEDVPVDADATAPTVDESALESLTSPEGRLADLLAVTRGHPSVAWAVDPALLEEAEAGGPHARTWFDEVTTRTLPGRDVFALPWSDPDLAAAAHAGHADLVGVARDLSAATPDDTFGVTPRTDLLWAPPTGTDSSTAALAATLGVGTLVVGSDLLVPTDLRVTAGSRTSVDTSAGTQDVLVPDATLDALLTDPTSVEPGATTATTVQRVLAETAVATREDAANVQHLLLAPARDWDPDVPTATAVLDALESAPWLQATPVSTLIGSSDTGADRSPLPTTARTEQELSAAEVNALATARADAQAFASVSDDPTSLLTGVDESLVAPLAVAWRDDPAGRAALVQQAVAGTQERLAGLSIAPLSNTNVVSTHSDVRVVVRNDLATAATVTVELRPAKACLTADDSPTVTVAAGAQETVPVALTATANCEVRVDALLTTATGHVVSPTVEFTARVSPTIEGVGTVVVGILLAVGLVLGIVRTVRRGQSARRGARTEAEAIATGEVASVGVLGGGAPATGTTAAVRPAPTEEKR